MVVKIKDLVRNEGEITTIEELDKEGLIEYPEVKNFLNRGKVMTKYFANIKGTKEGWEIGKLAYFNRTKQKDVKKDERKRILMCFISSWTIYTHMTRNDKTGPIGMGLRDGSGRKKGGRGQSSTRKGSGKQKGGQKGNC
jgi:hypothetical protein